MLHTEGATKYYSLRTLHVSSSSKYENVHTSSGLINDMGADEAAHCEELVQTMGNQSTTMQNTHVGRWEPTLSQSALAIMNTMNASGFAQHDDAVQIQASAQPTKLDCIPAQARTQFVEAVTTATRQGKVGLQRLTELKQINSDQAVELKEHLAQLTTMKNTVQHILDFNEDSDGARLTHEKLSVYMQDFANILTKVSLALTHAQNIIKVYSSKKP